MNCFWRCLYVPYTKIIKIPYYPEEPLLYPHRRNFRRFSDSIQYDIQKPIRKTNSDSSPSSSWWIPLWWTIVTRRSFIILPIKTLVTLYKSNYTSPNPPSNDNSSFSQNDSSPFKRTIKTHETNILPDRSWHPSQNQYTLPIASSRSVETHYNSRQQPRKIYRLFITLSKVQNSLSQNRTLWKLITFENWTGIVFTELPSWILLLKHLLLQVYLLFQALKLL